MRRNGVRRWLLTGLAAVLLCASPIVPAAAQSLDDDLERHRQSLEDAGHSHASGGRPEFGPQVLGNPTHAVKTIRVGLHYSYSPTGTYSEFFTRDHPSVRLSHTGGTVRIIDAATGKQIATVQPAEVHEVRHDGAGYIVTGPRGALGTFGGPMQFHPMGAETLFRVESIRRSGGSVVPQYRGLMEIARGTATAAGMVNLVNVVELESYVKGVVVNESLASFHIEALKAQAAAARGYAVANVGNWVARGYPFDLVDSSSSQVYRGATSEHPRGNQAVDETRALVASSHGRIISALYSSSMGGHTENNEWIFNSPAGLFPGKNAVPYLRGIYDGESTQPDLSTEAAARAFWTTPQPQTYDACSRTTNRLDRWKITLPATLIGSRLTTGRYVLESGTLTSASQVTGVEVVERMAASARIGVARIILNTGSVLVKGWTNMRAVLGSNGPQAAPSLCPGRPEITANFVLNNPSVIEPYLNLDGTFGGIHAYGGGWGHNVGMSQFGAHGRGLAGQNFVQILKAYYTGVDIGSFPIDIGRARSATAGTPTLRQEFVSPTGEGTLEIRAKDLRGLRVHFNERYGLSFTTADLAGDVVRADVTPYLRPGTNVVQYNPVGKGGTATVLVIVE